MIEAEKPRKTDYSFELQAFIRGLPDRKPVAVPVAPPTMISYSQVQTIQACEQKWKFGYVDRLQPKVTKDYLTLGTLVHELLAGYYDLLKSGRALGDPNAMETILEMVAQDIAPLVMEMGSEDLNTYNRALYLVQNYITRWSPMIDKGMEILATEYHFEIPMTTPKGRDFILHGYIDLVYRKDGQIWLLDHKTGTKKWTEDQVLFDSQLLTYAAALRNIGKEVFGVAINYINSYPYKDMTAQPLNKLFDRPRSYRTDKEMDFALENYRMAVDRILDRKESGTFARSLGRTCTSCQYFELCLFDMKGIPTASLIEEKYKLREDSHQSVDSNEDID